MTGILLFYMTLDK